MSKEEWIKTSIIKGYEGAGAIFTCNDYFVLCVNSKNEVEYPGGKVEMFDDSIKHTIQREIKEETSLSISDDRISTLYKITGGETGTPSYVSLIEISNEEFKNANDYLSKNSDIFSKLIKTKKIEQFVKDIDGDKYPLRKFNFKYVLPQIEANLPSL
jgi:8-oxo-dGTP pyrophosphatase MutT (NUDIX family)